MSLINQKRNQHLLWRAGFGPAVEQLQDLSQFSSKQFYAALKKASDKKPDTLNVIDSSLAEMLVGKKKKELSPEEKRAVQQESREAIKELNLAWLKQMVNSGAQLREKMAFFWHGHFACRNQNIYYMQGLLDVIRQHALGNFGTLLKEVSKTPAMLNFLNNQQNRKGHPNENFAREVMELFTLGRGHYTENDIKEAARAFTGWSSTREGEFIFRKNLHDEGVKTVLGKTGNLNGEDVLDILLQQKQTARFISEKIYKFFVNDNPDAEKVEWLTERFYKNNYDIALLMEDIFTSEWFYDEKNTGVKVKSPIELIAGIRRMIPMTLENEEALLLFQRILGQILFYPPNVAGWPGGKTWIDSSTLMMRMRIPQLFNDKDEMNVKPKDDDDIMMGRMEEMQKTAKANRKKKSAPAAGPRRINANLDWSLYVKHFEKTGRDKLAEAMAGILLQTVNGVNTELIKQYADQNSRDNFIKTVTIQIMSTPEYQLC